MPVFPDARARASAAWRPDGLGLVYMGWRSIPDESVRVTVRDPGPDHRIHVTGLFGTSLTTVRNYLEVYFGTASTMLLATDSDRIWSARMHEASPNGGNAGYFPIAPGRIGAKAQVLSVRCLLDVAGTAPDVSIAYYLEEMP